MCMVAAQLAKRASHRALWQMTGAPVIIHDYRWSRVVKEPEPRLAMIDWAVNPHVLRNDGSLLRRMIDFAAGRLMEPDVGDCSASASSRSPILSSSCSTSRSNFSDERRSGHV